MFDGGRRKPKWYSKGYLKELEQNCRNICGSIQMSDFDLFFFLPMILRPIILRDLDCGEACSLN